MYAVVRRYRGVTKPEFERGSAMAEQAATDGNSLRTELGGLKWDV
jgi:hypothetical protein